MKSLSNKKKCRLCPRPKRRDRALCSGCESRRWRAAQPVRAAFITLKYHATARGIPFSLTIDQFRRLCGKTKYLERRGPLAGDLTLDRIDVRLGYSAENLRVVTRKENNVYQGMDRRRGVSRYHRVSGQPVKINPPVESEGV